ncbi:6042_t:CDS:2, partial [Cetraspora pellucida]
SRYTPYTPYTLYNLESMTASDYQGHKISLSVRFNDTDWLLAVYMIITNLISSKFICEILYKQTDKLSEEFPFGTISSKCEHVASWCLKCLVIYIRETQHQCPICKIKLTDQEFNNYCLIWDNASFKIDLENFSQTDTKLSEQNIDSEIFYV